MKAVTAILLIAVVLGAVEARRPPPRRFPPPSPPPPSPSPPPPPSPSPPPPPSPSPPPPPSPRPPSPSPPPPPSPPSVFEFPHKCVPGNPISSLGALTHCTPYVVEALPANATSFSFRITARTPAQIAATCNIATSCKAMDMNDIKFSINNQCFGTVNNNIEVTNSTGTFIYSPTYGREVYPSTVGTSREVPGTTFRVIFNRANSGNVYSLGMEPVTVTFSLNGGRGCTKANFFETGMGFSGAHFAYFSPNKKCCGTNVAAFA